jgi:hypothetical protein
MGIQMDISIYDRNRLHIGHSRPQPGCHLPAGGENVANLFFTVYMVLVFQ